jgi:pimeloyl-ACP methyl ester carboxylesterase
MHLAEAGDPGAEAVVLLHGWPQHWYAWRKLIGPLAERYRVICPDLRGFGWTDAPPGSYLKSELAADVIALLDHLELDRVRLAGHDWGGFTGFLVATEAPERVSHYAAAGISHLWPQGDPGIGERLKLLSKVWYMLLIASPVVGRQVIQRVPAFVRNAMRKSAAKPAWNGEEIETFVAQWREPERAAACVGVYRSFLTKELPQLSSGAFADRRMEIPARLFVGTEDPVIDPESLQGFEANAPRMQLEVLEGVGHWVPEEAPEQMLAGMLELYAS